MKGLTLFQLAVLSNFTPEMLHEALGEQRHRAAVRPRAEHRQVRTYKPDPRAYALGPAALQLRRQETLFAPFAAWDAAGARWFGYSTFWVNRLSAVPEHLGVEVDGSAPGLADLVRYVLR